MFWAIAYSYLLLCLLLTSVQMEVNVNSSTYLASFTRLRSLLQARLAAVNKIPPKYYPVQFPIYLSFEPLQIIFVDEVSQAITISSGVTLVWVDPVLTWNPEDYNGIDTLEMDTPEFWTPNIYMPKSSDPSVKLVTLTDKVKVSSRSTVSTLIPVITKTLCNLDLTFFPYDSHTCSIVFMELNMYNLSHLDLPPKGISLYFGTNAAWILTGYGCVTQPSHYTPTFDYIVCSIEMRRRSAFYVINLIGPMAMTSAVTLVVFWLPAEGGEKMTFVVSMFLSSSVFYSYIQEVMPRSMDNPPRINLLLVFNGILIIMVTGATTFVLRRYEEQEILRPQGIHGGKFGKVQTTSVVNSVDKQRLYHPGRRRINAVSPEVSEQVNRSSISLVKTDHPKTRCCNRSRLTYQQLDMIFFVLFTALTIIVWLFIFYL